MLKHALVVVFVFIFVAAGMFDPPRAKAQTAAPAQAAAPPFNPGFADLMNTLVQPRHAKLGLSAREQNWALARYAAHELKDSLANIARWRPRFREQSVPDMMEATTGEPIKAVEAAIEARDLGKFNAAYARLTEGCNSCHAALTHEFIVIKEPDRSLFGNQDFRPAK
jgi:hypothetical protein